MTDQPSSPASGGTLRPGDRAEEDDAIIALNASTDPVLAELWDNPKGARYDEQLAQTVLLD